MRQALPHPSILAAGGLALALGVYLWVITPLADGITAREKKLADVRRTQTEARRLAGQLTTLKQGPAGPTLPEGFTLFSHVEGIATREGVKGQVEFMRPATRDLGGGRREMAVDLRLTGLGLNQFLAFMQNVESPEKGIRVRQLILQPSPKGGLDADLSVAVLQEKK